MIFLFTYLHFISLIALVSLLTTEFFLLYSSINDVALKLLKKVDLLYGIMAGVVLATGIARIFYEKGWEYYSHNMFFWTKITLFIIMGLISVYPTFRIIKAKSHNDIDVANYLKLKKAVMAQVIIVPLILFCAISMARGFS